MDGYARPGLLSQFEHPAVFNLQSAVVVVAHKIYVVCWYRRIRKKRWYPVRGRGAASDRAADGNVGIYAPDRMSCVVVDGCVGVLRSAVRASGEIERKIRFVPQFHLIWQYMLVYLFDDVFIHFPVDGNALFGAGVTVPRHVEVDRQAGPDSKISSRTNLSNIEA